MGAAPIGSANLNQRLSRHLPTSALSVGSHVLAATYLGDTNFNPSHLTERRAENGQSLRGKPTTTNLLVNPVSSTFGQTCSF